MQIVFATTTTTVSSGPGSHVVVHEGEHWLASDPIVQAHRELFTKDARHGLCSSVPIPEDDAEPEVPVDVNWQKIAELGYTPDEAIALVEAAARKKLEEEQADAGKSQAPVEQATKAPGEKRTTRRG
jgi:hypothetical protein